MSTTYWHVASSNYDGGDLLCWNTLEARGLVTADDWKWGTAPVGADGHLVSLASTLEEIDWMLDEFGGQVLRVEIPDSALTDDPELDWDSADEARVHLTSITEGADTFAAALARIPAAYITIEVQK